MRTTEVSEPFPETVNCVTTPVSRLV